MHSTCMMFPNGRKNNIPNGFSGIINREKLFGGVDMEKIKEIRQKTGKTQAKFAKTYGIRLNTLSAWESGENEPPEYVTSLLKRFVDEDTAENFPKPPNVLGVGMKRIYEISGLEKIAFAKKYLIPVNTVYRWLNGNSKPTRHIAYLLERAVREDTYEPWKSYCEEE